MLTLAVIHPDLADLLRGPVTAAYLLTVGTICVFGVHRFWLLLLYLRGNAKRFTQPESRFDTPPRVTVQVPLFNEGPVAKRVIDAVCRLDYPADRLQVQVLDDSTDDSVRVAAEACDAWRARGVDVDHVRRPDRAGFKAGALQHGLASATGGFIAVFDADFLPDPTFLRQTIDHFCDERVGLVQTRWGHLNRRGGPLTWCQSILLDGHFAIEHEARNATGRWIHFNGTGGVWRRAAIDDAGGWSADTLSEDLDLSLRAQARGWRCRFLSPVECRAELPPTVLAYKSQQHRWAKGTMQVARRYFWPLMRSPAPLAVKSELLFQLTWPVASVLITLSALLYFPAFFIDVRQASGPLWSSGVLQWLLLTAGLCSAAAFYTASQVLVGVGLLRGLLSLPLLIAFGAGIALTNTKGVAEAMLGLESGFVRTPKYNRLDHQDNRNGATGDAPSEDAQSRSKWPWGKLGLIAAELSIAAYMVVCIAVASTAPATIISIPLLLLFLLGYGWFATASILDLATARRRQAPARRGRRLVRRPAAA